MKSTSVINRNGYSVEIEKSGKDYFAHRAGFTKTSLVKVLCQVGFSPVYSKTANLEINAIACKGAPNAATRALFNLPQELPGGELIKTTPAHG